jgi:hypothetical protein
MDVRCRLYLEFADYKARRSLDSFDTTANDFNIRFSNVPEDSNSLPAVIKSNVSAIAFTWWEIQAMLQHKEPASFLLMISTKPNEAYQFTPPGSPNDLSIDHRSILWPQEYKFLGDR